MDLRKEIHDIIEETGHYVLLQRTSRRLRCICYDEKTQESSPSRYAERTGSNRHYPTCPRCLGLGWVVRLERVKTRRQMASNIISLPGKKQLAPYGHVNVDTRIFFFEHNVAPRKGDRIIEVGWDKKRPTHVIHVHNISNSDDMREKNGRIEFFQVTTKEDIVNKDYKGFTARKIGNMINYEFLR